MRVFQSEKIQVDKKFALQPLLGSIKRQVHAKAALGSGLAKVVEQRSKEIAVAFLFSRAEHNVEQQVHENIFQDNS